MSLFCLIKGGLCGHGSLSTTLNGVFSLVQSQGDGIVVVAQFNVVESGKWR